MSTLEKENADLKEQLAVANRTIANQMANVKFAQENANKLGIELDTACSTIEALNSKLSSWSFSDSVIASCQCLTKTNEVHYHAAGCKYRLIMERNSARMEAAAYKASFEEGIKQLSSTKMVMERGAAVIEQGMRCMNSLVSKWIGEAFDARYAANSAKKYTMKDLQKNMTHRAIALEGCACDMQELIKQFSLTPN